VKDLEGKGIIVTGATRGIGRAIALEAARRGANVAFNYLKSEQQAEELRAGIGALGVKAIAFKTDVADLKAVRAMVNAAKAEFGRLDGVVNNAGLTRDKLLVMMSEEDWSAVIQTNLTGAFNVARASAFIMMKAKRGAIINITSISGLVGMAGQVNYSASKAGLVGMTKAMAKDNGLVRLSDALEKAGKRHSKMDQERVQMMHAENRESANRYLGRVPTPAGISQPVRAPRHGTGRAWRGVPSARGAR